MNKNAKSPSFDKAGLRKAGAVQKSIPKSVSPQLATLYDTAPAGNDWIHETKYDGYRILAFIDSSGTRLISRNQLDWTKKFLHLADSLSTSTSQSLILDGEVCVADEQGKSSFSLLQKSFKSDLPTSYLYYVFDLVYWNGWDVRPLPLMLRKSYLKQIVTSLKIPEVIFSTHVQGKGPEVFETAEKMGWEGIISKNVEASYVSVRSDAWRKIKCTQRDEFIIAGYTPLKDRADAIGALLLAYPDELGLTYCGRVGTGFSQTERQLLFKQLSPLVSTQKDLYRNIEKARENVWIKPKLVAQVAFTEWTSDNRLRHPAFLGMREDKKVKEVSTAPPLKKRPSKKENHSVAKRRRP